MTEDEKAQRVFDSWLARAKVELPPKLADAAVAMSFVSGGDPGDISPQAALELGYILLMGKPLVVVVATGGKVPPGLAKAADDIVEGDLADESTKARLAAVIARYGVEQN